MESKTQAVSDKPISPTVGNADTLEKLIARVNFYESSVEQLKKELPKYLQQQSELEKSHHSFSKVMKSIASSEPHNLLQYFLFSYAQKEEELAAVQQELYTNLLPVSKETLDNWTKKLIHPIRDVIEDHIAYHKTNPAAKTKEIAAPPPNNPNPALAAPGTTLNNPNNATTDVNNSQSSLPNDPSNLQLLKSVLPVHAKLFEKHRIQESKQFFKLLLTREIHYHAMALESYSQLLECLSEIEEQEMIHWNQYYGNSNTALTSEEPQDPLPDTLAIK